MIEINEDFEKWWDENEAQFMADACHMSEFHMAGVVWNAAVKTMGGAVPPQTAAKLAKPLTSQK